MRSFWTGLGRVGCHCHCYTCIEKRHVHVRKLFTLAARLRSGRLLKLEPVRSRPQLRTLNSVGRPLGVGRLRGVKKDDIEESNARRSQEQVGQWYDPNSILRTEDEVAQERIQREEQELQEVANDLKSLSIDHWSLDDVVTFEPQPGGPTPPAIPSTTQADPNTMMPQSPWASDTLKRQNYSRVWTRKKIAKMETAIAQFVLRVCGLFRLESQRPSNLIVLPEAIRPFARLSKQEQKHWLGRQLGVRMRVLSNKAGYVDPNDPGEVPVDIQDYLPHYEHFDDGLHHELLRDLNASLVELFDGYKNKQLDFLALMVKICHNLLVSSAPPNVQTMNILLLGFYSTDKYLPLASSQVRHLILDWLIYICLAVKIRPNEITCATILATYRRRGMHTAFTEFVMLMRGTWGERGLMFTKPISLTQQNAKRLTPTKEYSKIFKQSVYPSPMIFAEVIKGVVKFYNPSDAVAICKDFTAKEWGYDWSCLQYLLQSCIVQKDWESGLWVWSEIQNFRTAGHQEPRNTLAAMLALCVQCQQQDMFAEVLKYSTSAPRSFDQSEMVKTATAILNRAVERMDEEELAAAKLDAGEEEEANRGVYERGSLERRVFRRLGDDANFMRAVFGLGRVVRSGHRRLKYFEQTGDALRIGERAGDISGNLLRESEGGFEVDENDMKSSTVHQKEDGQDSGDAERHFGDSPMDFDENEAELQNGVGGARWKPA